MGIFCSAYIVAGTLISFVGLTSGRIFSPQGLAEELKSQRVSEWEIPTLVCVAQNASNLNTNATRYLPMRNIRLTLVYYGIFGIPDEWMEKCDITKERLLDDNIHDDVNCLNIYLTRNDRKSAFHMLTPGEIDLDKCLDWWDQLPLTLESSHNNSQVATNIEVTGCSLHGYSYLLTTSVLLLNVLLAIIAYFVYNLTKQLRKNLPDNLSQFPLV